MNFYNHFYDIVISLHNYHYIYLFIIIVVPIASLIKKITCFIQCSINSNIEISSILFPASCVLTLFFNILHYIHSTWYIGLPGHKSISFITFSFLQKSRFIRNNKKAQMYFCSNGNVFDIAKTLLQKSGTRDTDSNFMTDYM